MLTFSSFGVFGFQRSFIALDAAVGVVADECSAKLAVQAGLR